MNKKNFRSCAALCSAAIFLLLSLEKSSAAPVETISDVWTFLEQFGYAPKSGGDSSAEALKQSIMDMQHMAGINQTGELDKETMKLMNTPRCAVGDHVGHNNDARRRKRRYAIQGSRWSTRDLTYGYTSYTNQLSQSDQRSIFQRAFQFWSAVSPLKFTETSPSDASIQILFGKRSHGDCCPFDGSNGVLAHAFYPQYGGDAHFDDDETWTQNTNTGYNLLQVAIHEFGHSLGLGHSSVIGAIMYPYYSGYDPNPQLTSDDIAGIQYLYGPPTVSSSTTTSRATPTRNSVITGVSSSSVTIPTTTVRPVPAICSNPQIDAIVVVDGTTYAFSNTDYYVLTSSNGIAPGYPRSISSQWSGISGRVDAALYYPRETTRDQSGRTVVTKPAYLFLFQGTRYWRYTEGNQLDANYPREIRYGFPGIPDNIDAVFQWSGNGRIFFIKGDQYYRYNPMIGTDAGYPKPLYVWSGLPNNAITAAFQWINGRTYFFAGTKYYRFDDYNFRVDRVSPSYPRDNGEWWLGCSSSLSSGDTKSENENDRNIFIEVGSSSSSQLSCFHFNVILVGAFSLYLITKYI